LYHTAGKGSFQRWPPINHLTAYHVIFDSFITRSIESGDSRAETFWYRHAMSQSSNPPGSKSPYGLWVIAAISFNPEPEATAV
jgi:hypothetical protein